MTITTSRLGQAAGIATAVAGTIFVLVQINHPAMEVASVTTTDWFVRSTAKTVMTALALAGITGMYLRQRATVGVLRPGRLPAAQRRLLPDVRNRVRGRVRAADRSDVGARAT